MILPSSGRHSFWCVVIFVGCIEGNIYVVDFLKKEVKLATCLMSKTEKGWLWQLSARPHWHKKLAKSSKVGAHPRANRCCF